MDRTDAPHRSPAAKRAFDIGGALVLLSVAAVPLALAWLAAALETRSTGLFLHRRIGRHGVPFDVIKLRTMRTPRGSARRAVTTAATPGIGPVGRCLRATKLDELPQLLNVLAGQMSLVGPRPDVAGFADRLTGRDRVILRLRPGITGPATLAFADEERILARVSDPVAYNARVIWPAKVAINRDYALRGTLWTDAAILTATLVPLRRLRMRALRYSAAAARSAGSVSLNSAP